MDEPKRSSPLLTLPTKVAVFPPVAVRRNRIVSALRRYGVTSIPKCGVRCCGIRSFFSQPMIPVADSVNDLPPKQDGKTRFVCVSDTHGKTKFKFPIPNGDVFIHSGDITKYSAEEEWIHSIAWIKSLPHRVKIVTGGNHDSDLDDRYRRVANKQQILAYMESTGITYLEHEPYRLPDELGGFKMFVSPYAPKHLGGAFMPHNLTPYWESIPSDTQILVTHTPPFGYHDRTSRGAHVGCPVLRRKIEAIRPLVCVFGHIHEAHGWSQPDGTLMINACICDRRYRASQRPVIFDL